MKNNLLKSIFLSVTLMAFMSCGDTDNEENVYSGGTYISFGADTASSALESSTVPITITAYASVPNLQSDITVETTITGDNATAANYTVVDGKSSFTFGPNKYTDTIQIIPVDNVDEDGVKTLSIMLSSASDGSTLGLPGPDGNSNTFKVTLEDDDCAFTLTELGAASWSGMDNASGSNGPNASKTTTSFDGTNLLFEGIGYGWMENTGGWDEVVILSHKLISAMNPITGAMTIAEQPMCTTTWNGNIQPDYTLSATGQYVSCTETLTIDFQIFQGGSSTPLRTYTEILTIN